MRLIELRRQYHHTICADILRMSNGVVNIADKDNRSSKEISLALINQLGYPVSDEVLPGQSAGSQFEQVTKGFLEQAFALLQHLRPGSWGFNLSTSISQFDQYSHLGYIQSILSENPLLASALGGDYLITPDIVVARNPISDGEINTIQPVLDDEDAISEFTPLRIKNQSRLILHASISCKWTIRSDRAQNARTEALNLIRNRKGRTPII